MLEGFGSKCCKNFEGFTNPASVPRTTLHKTHYVVPTLRCSNYGGKTKFQILFKILAFPVHGNNRNGSIIILWRYNMFLPDCWLQFHNNNNLLVSKTTTVLKQDRPSASIDTSDMLHRLWFTSPRNSTIDVQDCGW